MQGVASSFRENLLEKKPRVVWMTPLCTTQRTQQSQSRSRFHRIQMNILVVFLWLVEQDRCEAILEQMWCSTSLGRGGAFSELKEQFHSGGTPGCLWGSLADGTLSSKSWYFICSHRRWSELLYSRRCLHDDPHQNLEVETLQYTPQLVITVGKEIMKVESSKQTRSLACCSMKIDRARVTWWLQPCQKKIQSSRKMLIVDSVKKNSEPLTNRLSAKKTRTQTHHRCSQKVQLQRL